MAGARGRGRTIGIGDWGEEASSRGNITGEARKRLGDLGLVAVEVHWEAWPSLWSMW